MPDGNIAICYAEAVANGVAKDAYPHGFEHHYYNPERIAEPRKLKRPARIFIDSMSDLFGAWVPEQQIKSILSICAQCDWHTFLVLTKNAPRLLKFADQCPDNLHAGVSMPPDSMLGKSLSRHQQESMLRRSLQVLDTLPRNLITWMSFEPLSWDVAPILNQYPTAIRWAVIGAASNGRTYYQPNSEHVNHLLDVLDENNIPVFFKGNLKWDARREEYPE
jgi:protein gp37